MLKISTLAQEGAYKISKTIKIPVLLEYEEFKSLLEMLGDVCFYEVQGIVKCDEGVIDKKAFLDIYRLYLDLVKKGGEFDLKQFYSPFSSALSCTSNTLYSIVIDEKRRLIKASKPVIQLQLNQIQYSNEDGSFRSMVYGEQGISWGVLFSYPQIYQDPHTQDIFEVDEGPQFPNTHLFRKLQKWVRSHTMATPFIVGDRRINVPIRLGKKCFSWINCHPQLVKKGIKVRVFA